jgi:hypothetical protein
LAGLPARADARAPALRAVLALRAGLALAAVPALRAGLALAAVPALRGGLALAAAPALRAGPGLRAVGAFDAASALRAVPALRVVPVPDARRLLGAERDFVFAEARFSGSAAVVDRAAAV